MNELIKLIDNIPILTEDIYYKLLKKYSKNIIDKYLDKIIEKELSLCIDKEDKIKIWNKYGYYLSTKEHSIYEKYELENVDKKENSKEYKWFSNKDEIVYGIHLLSKQYLTILKEPNNETTLDIEKVLTSIKTKETRNYILNKLTEFYNITTRTSNNDLYIKRVLENYSNLQKKVETTNITNNKIYEDEYLKEQIDMYIRYSIAKEKFIIANLPLVRYIINKWLGIDYDNEDLKNEGKIGLINAVNTYDIRYGYKFSTYAFHVIKNAIKLSANKYEEGIVLPIQKYHQKYKLQNKQNELALKLKRNPTTKELANYLEVSEKHLIKFLEILELVDYRYLTQEIDYGHEDMPNLTLEETVADKDANFEEKVLYKGVLKEILEQIDTILTPNEKDILFKRNGYNVPNEQTLTLSEIAKEKNISAEAVRKIEQKALRKLKCYKVKRYNPFN